MQLGQNEEVSVRTIDINRPANLAERKAGGCLFMVGGKPLRFLDRPGLVSVGDCRRLGPGRF